MPHNARDSGTGTLLNGNVAAALRPYERRIVVELRLYRYRAGPAAALRMSRVTEQMIRISILHPYAIEAIAR